MAPTNSEFYIGLMSGTSLDAMDAVLVNLESEFPALIGQVSLPFPSRLRNQLTELCQPGDNEIEAMCEADLAVAILASDAVSLLLDEPQQGLIT